MTKNEIDEVNHNINNPNAVVVMTTTLMKKELVKPNPDLEKLQSMIDDIDNQIKRVTSYVRGLE